MSDLDARNRDLELPTLPAAVERISRSLADAGQAVFTVGPCLRDLIAGVSPPHFELSTSASLTALTRLLPDAILIDSQHERLMIPTSAGPVDLTPFQAGPRIEDDLAHRDFTINAMAYEADRKELLDPYGGRADLADGLLRAVRSARDRFAEDPLRALRGIRLAATRGWKLDPEVESELGPIRERLAEIPREPIRRELKAILLSPGVTQAIDQLERSGITADLAPSAVLGSGAVLERLPPDLELRLAGWLRGTHARPVLQKLRFSSGIVHRVEALLRLHPVSTRLDPANRTGMIRFARRTGSLNLNALIALEEAEVDVNGNQPAKTRDVLRGLREALDELRVSNDTASRRRRLDISGADVMRQLDCKPGPRIGRALAYLTERVALDPALNTPGRLRELLCEWIDAGSENDC
jgi:tRNA nucleotidyltransferase (CCA-adding enzyme)